MPLTNLKVRALRPDGRPRRYSDGGNMYLEVKPNGSKLWRMAYSYAGKQETLAFGIYPETSLAETRERRSEANALLRGGIDPIENAREIAAQRQAEFGNPFSEIAEELLEKNRREGLAETTLSKKAWLLTSTLIVIDITLAGLFWAPSENADVIASLIKKVLYVGFVAFLSEVIFESFAGLGLTAGSSLITADDLMRPGYIASVGFQAALPLLEEAGGLMGPIPDRTPAKLTLALNPENRTRSLRPGSEGSGDRIALVACS